jgi:aspartate/methionine/tyrosine aminotransferase
LSALTGQVLPPDRVHTVWGFAKDFGLPGLKVGVLHTTDPAVRAAARELAYFAPVSTDTQAVLCSLLAGQAWTDAFLAAARARLGDSYARIAGLLDKYRIGYLPAAAGFSVWIDLGRWLPEPGFGGETALWHRLWDEARVNILPGTEFHCPEPGWFRVCHATEPATVTEAVGRLARLLEEASGIQPRSISGMRRRGCARACVASSARRRREAGCFSRPAWCRTWRTRPWRRCPDQAATCCPCYTCISSCWALRT